MKENPIHTALFFKDVTKKTHTDTTEALQEHAEPTGVNQPKATSANQEPGLHATAGLTARLQIRL